ncbi:hypothetical protein KBJ94_29520, partial [Pseudomonas sp. ITA]|uniref:hypothetical protein n=1 Tax=Pseudomonas sp. ITA TaxID=2825841 RepID=UPI002496FCFE
MFTYLRSEGERHSLFTRDSSPCGACFQDMLRFSVCLEVSNVMTVNKTTASRMVVLDTETTGM